MPIIRNTSQGAGESLEEFYQELVETEDFPDGAQAMLRLLQRINELFVDTQLWGLTSLYRLVIQQADDWTSDWLVTIAAGMDSTYRLEYLLPASARPWPQATVHGEAETLAEAERYLLIAMRESRGWADNAELSALLARYGLSG